jgi:trinucleotide repeat-containing gene 6 protein
MLYLCLSSTWSTSLSQSSSSGWPDQPPINQQQQQSQQQQQVEDSFGDLVPEFEPGKPWKGNHLKSVEDDPTLTPGSVRTCIHKLH